MEVPVRPVRSLCAMLPFETWIAVAALYVGLSHLLPFLGSAGNAQVVALRFPHLANVWSALYAVGGAGILIGLYRGSPRLEGFGLHLLGSGVTVACLASFAVGGRILPTIVIQGGVIVACVTRLLALRAPK